MNRTLMLCELIVALIEGGLTLDDVLVRIRDTQPDITVLEADAIRELIHAIHNHNYITRGVIDAARN